MVKIQVNNGKGETTINTNNVWDRIVALEDNVKLQDGSKISEEFDKVNSSLAEKAQQKDLDNIGKQQINMVQFNPNADGVTADDTTISQALNYIANLSYKSVLYKNVVLDGNGFSYYVTSPIVLPKNIEMSNFNFIPSPTLTELITIGDGITRINNVNLKKITINATNANDALIGIHAKYMAYCNWSELKFSGKQASTQKAFLFEGLESFAGNRIDVYGSGTGISVQNGPSGVNNATFNSSYVADCGVNGLDLGDQLDSLTFNMPYFELCQVAIKLYTGSITIINPIFDAITSYWLNYTYSGGCNLTLISSYNQVSDLIPKINDVTRTTTSNFLMMGSIGVRKISKPSNGKYDYLSVGASPDLTKQRINIYPDDYSGIIDNFTTIDGISLVYRSSSYGAFRILTQDGTEQVKFSGAGNQTIKGGFTVGSVGALPTASASNRGMFLRVLGNGTTTADTIYICMQSATGTYSWKPIVTG